MSPSQKQARNAVPNASYNVSIRKNGVKALTRAPQSIMALFDLLVEELATEGPEQTEWPHYKQLKGMKGQKKREKRYHCHLAAGRPQYVAVWRMFEQTIEIEVTYAGTHENAPY